jgi:hypothetical protein
MKNAQCVERLLMPFAHRDANRLILFSWVAASIGVGVSTARVLDWSHGWLGKTLLLVAAAPLMGLVLMLAAMVLVIAVMLPCTALFDRLTRSRK